jgi:hypothetical protein
MLDHGDPRRPGARHLALNILLGRWRVDMTTHGEDGPVRSEKPLRAEKSQFGEGRYVHERVEGDFGGSRHEKLTLLGFNNTRSRYEYATADNHDAVLLLYVSRPDASEAGDVIDLYADYVSPGDAAPRGVLLAVRTRLEIISLTNTC